MSLAALLAAVLGLGAARAAEVEVVPVRGALETGIATEVLVGVRLDDGTPLDVPPEVTVDGAAWRRLERPAGPGVWRFVAAAPSGTSRVEARVSWPGGSATRTIPVRAPEPPSLQVRAPARVAARADVVLTITGEGLPPRESLQVVASEGRVVGVVEGEGRLEVTLRPDDVPRARLLVVGVRDARREALPAWTVVRLQAALDLPVSWTPGSVVTVDVGGRRVGPVTIPESGTVVVPFEHGPDEPTARVRVVEPGGTEVNRTLALVGEQEDRLVPFVTGPRYPDEAPPDVLLRGVRADGRPWSREAPVCVTPRAGTLPVVPVEAGTWRVELPPDLPSDWDVRVRCTLGSGIERALSIPLAEGVPVALDLDIFPEVLSTDLPEADLRAFLVNATGERVPARGRFVADAELGFVDLDVREGAAILGRYRADLAAEVGEDVVRLDWHAAPGDGEPDRLSFAPGPVLGDLATVRVRVLDDDRRPLTGRPVSASAGGTRTTAITGADGWAEVLLPRDRSGLLVVEAASGVRHAFGLVLPGAEPAPGPGRPDLSATVDVQVDAGRVAQVDLVVEPRVVRPRGSARVDVRLLDRNGDPARAEDPPVLVASEGTLVPEGRLEDGRWRWTWLPPAGFRARRVDIFARTRARHVEASEVVEVRPATVDRYVGLSGGVHTNFGVLTAPTAQLDLAFRVRIGPRDQVLPPGRSRLFVRAGASWYGARTFEGPVEGSLLTFRRDDLFPVHLGVDVRQEYPTQAYWFSLLALLTPVRFTEAYGDLTYTSTAVLEPGVSAAVGYGVRVPGGEIALELRGSLLNPVKSARLERHVGGLAATVGYRVFF